MKLCLVVPGNPDPGHPWDFFAATLAVRGVTVDTFRLETLADEAAARDLAARRASGALGRLVLWGVDDLALHLRSHDEAGRLVIVPAPATERDESWWQQFQTSQFVALSRDLHGQLQLAGLTSAHFQPYAQPVPGAALVDVITQRSALLWEPRGSTLASVGLALRQCRALGLHRLQVAICASDHDRAELEALQTQCAGMLQLAPATAHFRADSVAAQLREHICLFLPQLDTGLDPVLLQALATGRFIVAPDAPMLRDYIGHLATGLLYRASAPEDLPLLDNGRFRVFLAASLTKATRGHARWLADFARLLSVLTGDDRRWSASDRSAEFGNRIRRNANLAARRLSQQPPS